jgi:hypothetical protein
MNSNLFGILRTISQEGNDVCVVESVVRKINV